MDKAIKKEKKAIDKGMEKLEKMEEKEKIAKKYLQ